MKQLCTDKQIEAYRLVSPDFGNLTTYGAAEKSGKAQSTIVGLLGRLKINCPSLFPVIPMYSPNDHSHLVRFQSWMENIIREKF